MRDEAQRYEDALEVWRTAVRLYQQLARGIAHHPTPAGQRMLLLAKQLQELAFDAVEHEARAVGRAPWVGERDE